MLKTEKIFLLVVKLGAFVNLRFNFAISKKLHLRLRPKVILDAM